MKICGKVNLDLSLDKSPIPATKRPIPDANKTESKPLSCHSFKKYTIKAKTDTNQSHFKYFITLLLQNKS